MELLFQEMFSRGLLIAFRIAGLMTFAPFFSNATIPIRIRGVLTVLITIALTPFYGVAMALGSNLLRTIAGELAVGFALGLSMQFALEAAHLAGQLMGIQIGYSLVNLIDPTTEVDTPVLSVFHQLVMVLLFLQMNGHHWLLRSVARSFDTMPPGSALAALSGTTALLEAAKTIFVSGVQLAAPVLAVTILMDLALAFLGRAIPQLPVLFLRMTFNTWLGFAIVIASVAAWPRIFGGYFQAAFRFSEQMLHIWR